MDSIFKYTYFFTETTSPLSAHNKNFFSYTVNGRSLLVRSRPEAAGLLVADMV